MTRQTLRQINNYVPVEDCKDGYLYQLRSRNLTYGIYQASNQTFIGIRNKFNHEFLDAESHWDSGHGTVKPLRELEKAPAWNLTKYYNTIGKLTPDGPILGFPATCPVDTVMNYLYDAVIRFPDEPSQD